MKYILYLFALCVLFASCTPKYYWEINTALLKSVIQHEERIIDLEKRCNEQGISLTPYPYQFISDSSYYYIFPDALRFDSFYIDEIIITQPDSSLIPIDQI